MEHSIIEIFLYGGRTAMGCEIPHCPESETSLRRLIDGNASYLDRESNPSLLTDLIRIRTAHEGQKPWAAVVCCADSRVPPEHIFSAGIGELFVIRNAGNVVDEDVLGSVEYAVEHLGASVLVVMGHSSCGAVTATCENGELPGNISVIARRIRPAVSAGCCVDDNAQRHAKRMAQLLKDDPIVRHLQAEVVAAFYDIKSGEVTFL